MVLRSVNAAEAAGRNPSSLPKRLAAMAALGFREEAPDGGFAPGKGE
jgi:hypothetical protein